MSDPWVRHERIGACDLYLGDCLDVMPALGPVNAVVTDPPYGMSFQSGHRSVPHKKIAGDHDGGMLEWAAGLQFHHSAYIWMRWDNIPAVPLPKSLITWVKDNHSMGDLNHEHGRQTEVCAFYSGPDHYFPKQRPTDVIKAPRTGNEFHPTQKPVGLMETVVNWTAGVVVDPFLGSGTTLVACAKLGRKGIGIELDPEYFEIACKRVEEAYRQPDLFVEPPKPAVQEGFDL